MTRTRGSGSLFRQKTSRVWWVKYYNNGRAYRESTHTADRKKAQQFLSKRLAEIASGTFSGFEIERITITELADGLLRDYRVNGRSSLDDVQARWTLHLEPFFGSMRAASVSSDLLARYVDERQQQGAANATINRELAALKRMFRLGMGSTPPKVYRVPAFPHLQEDNIRTGFFEDAQYEKLVEGSELWFRALVECGRTYGWRISELLTMRVGQVNLINRTIRLEPGTTKNREGREVTMTKAVYDLLAACVSGKASDDHVFTRSDSTPVRDFREQWKHACTAAGVPNLLFHDLRRTAARNLRRAGVAEGVIMKIGGWKTRSVFERYAIVAQSDIEDAMKKLEAQASTVPEDASEHEPTRKPQPN
jgi:integrase